MTVRSSVIFWALASLLAVEAVGAADGAGDPPQALVAGSDARGPGAARTLLDLAYGPLPEERLDVYLPVQGRSSPVIFMVHGGGWMLGDKANANVVGSKASHWLAKGFVFVSVNYPLLPRADPLQQASAVAKALAFAQRQASSWGADPDRFVVMGHSSGSHLAALLTADPALATAQGAKPWLGTVALDSAALDVAQIMEAPHLRFYDRVFKGDPAYWRNVSPLHRLQRSPVPMLLVCSSQRADSCAQARAFAAKANGLGGRASVLPVALAHDEINRKLGGAGDFTDAVDAFLHATLGLP